MATVRLPDLPPDEMKTLLSVVGVPKDLQVGDLRQVGERWIATHAKAAEKLSRYREERQKQLQTVAAVTTKQIAKQKSTESRAAQIYSAMKSNNGVLAAQLLSSFGVTPTPKFEKDKLVAYEYPTGLVVTDAGQIENIRQELESNAVTYRQCAAAAKKQIGAIEEDISRSDYAEFLTKYHNLIKSLGNYKDSSDPKFWRLDDARERMLRQSPEDRIQHLQDEIVRVQRDLTILEAMADTAVQEAQTVSDTLTAIVTRVIRPPNEFWARCRDDFVASKGLGDAVMPSKFAHKNRELNDDIVRFAVSYRTKVPTVFRTSLQYLVTDEEIELLRSVVAVGRIAQQGVVRRFDAKMGVERLRTAIGELDSVFFNVEVLKTVRSPETVQADLETVLAKLAHREDGPRPRGAGAESGQLAVPRLPGVAAGRHSQNHPAPALLDGKKSECVGQGGPEICPG